MLNNTPTIISTVVFKIKTVAHVEMHDSVWGNYISSKTFKPMPFSCGSCLRFFSKVNIFDKMLGFSITPFPFQNVMHSMQSCLFVEEEFNVNYVYAHVY